jgi:ribonuclease HI
MQTPKKQVTIYIDGKVPSEPGPGGWGALLMFGPHRKELNGYQADTDRNRMQLFAAISGLGALKESCIVNLCTDSSSLFNILSQQLYLTWLRQNWKDASGNSIPNRDLWFILSVQLKKHSVRPTRIGTSADENMSRCKELASEALQEYIDINTEKENEDSAEIEITPEKTAQSPESVK